MYEGLVESHNWRYTKQFILPGNYYNMLKKEYDQLVVALEAIQEKEIGVRISKYLVVAVPVAQEAQ